ncbi:MAG: NPCBM/NEW2 domain-containing protein, partial [Abditibacteriota bacterium]|nr:NPCBM/NEW2 domain-containing protein [Abditibacteriota bacterium]
MKTMIYISLLLLILAVLPAAAETPEEFADRAFRGENTLSGADASMEVIEELLPGTIRINRSAHTIPETLSVGGRQFARGLGTHANTHMRFTFARPVKAFVCTGGVQDGRPDVATVRASVEADGKKVYSSPVCRAGQSVDVSAPCGGAKTVDLILDDAGDGISCDQFDWCEARFVMEDGSVTYADEIVSQSRFRHRYPFSFTYGGRPSDTLLPGWQFSSKSETVSDTEILRTYSWQEPEGPLAVTAEVKIYKDAPALDWTVYFENTGSGNTPVISDLRAMELELFAGRPDPDAPEGVFEHSADEEAETKDVELLTLHGSDPGHTADVFKEFIVMPRYLQNGEHVNIHNTLNIWPTWGEYAPYWAVRTSGGGAVCGLGWTGNWTGDFRRTEDSVRISAGFPGDKFRAYLRPGEKVRSPRAMAALYTGKDIQQGFNAWRRAMLRHVSPQVDGQPAMIPLAASLSVLEAMGATAETDKRYIEAISGLGLETCWMDAWYTRDKWPAGIGNYHEPIEDMVDPERYPDGLEPLVELAEKDGMNILMWFGPETVQENTFVVREHPEYVMQSGKDPVHSLAIGEKDAREYMLGLMNSAIKKYHIRVFRTDSGISEDNLNGFYRDDDTEDRRGIAENKYCAGLYAFWDGMLAANPGLVIDNCCAGGSRLDLEMMSRTISMWRTDVSCGLYTAGNRSAYMNQIITSGLNYFIPWSTSGCQGDEPYQLRSAYNTGLSFAEPALIREDYDRETVKRALEEFKRLRPYHLLNYNLLFAGDLTDNCWCAWQYSAEDKSRGYAMVFRRSGTDYAGLTLNMRDIDHEARYRVRTFRSFDLDEEKVMEGRELQRYTAIIYDKPGSLLIEYSL